MTRLGQPAIIAIIGLLRASVGAAALLNAQCTPTAESPRQDSVAPQATAGEPDAAPRSSPTLPATASQAAGAPASTRGHTPSANADDASGHAARPAGAGAASHAAAGRGAQGVGPRSAGAGSPDSGTPDTAPPANDAGSPMESDTGRGEGGTAEQAGKLSAFIEMRAIPSGAEAHRCVVVELPNPEPVWVSSLHAHLGDGSHHLIVDRRAPSDEVATQAFDCSPTMAGDATRLLIAQQRDTTLALPSSVGYHLDAHQRLFLQLHYINVTAGPLTIRGEVELSPLPDDAKPIEARSVFTGSTAISLPPREAGTATHFQAFASDPAWHVFALTSHTHQLGVRTTIERVASADAPEAAPLHESLDWAEPPLTVFDTPLEFRGDDGLRLTCRYMNTTDRTVSFGVGVQDEMCFMWLYYFVNEAP